MDHCDPHCANVGADLFAEEANARLAVRSNMGWPVGALREHHTRRSSHDEFAGENAVRSPWAFVIVRSPPRGIPRWVVVPRRSAG